MGDVFFCVSCKVASGVSCKLTHWKFNSLPSKDDHPKRKGDSLPSIIFQGRAVKLEGCIIQESNW